MGGLQLSLSLGLYNFASLETSGIFPAMIGAECVPGHGASVADWVHIRRRIAGGQLRGKEKGVNFYQYLGQKRRERMARVAVLREWRCLVRPYREVNRFALCGGLGIVGSTVAGKRRAAILKAKIMISKMRPTLLFPTSGARVFTE